jgi:hypothetical protein
MDHIHGANPNTINNRRLESPRIFIWPRAANFINTFTSTSTRIASDSMWSSGSEACVVEGAVVVAHRTLEHTTEVYRNHFRVNPELSRFRNKQKMFMYESVERCDDLRDSLLRRDMRPGYLKEMGKRTYYIQPDYCLSQ